jgi:hypothetical protein
VAHWQEKYPADVDWDVDIINQLNDIIRSKQQQLLMIFKFSQIDDIARSRQLSIVPSVRGRI